MSRMLGKMASRFSVGRHVGQVNGKMSGGL